MPLPSLLHRTWRALPPIRRWREQNDQLRAELRQALHDRDALEQERDGLQQVAAALDWKIREELPQAAVDRDRLERERDELRRHVSRLELQAAENEADWLAHLARLEAELASLRRHISLPPGHFYSPIVNPQHQHARQRAYLVNDGAAVAAGHRLLDDDVLWQTFEQLAKHYPVIGLPDSATPGWRYHCGNVPFGPADAITLAALLLEHRPARVVEVGSGWSSCVLMDINDRYLDGRTSLTLIEPYPDTLRTLLSPDDRYWASLVQSPVQAVPLAEFARLQPGDFLVIDSSHVVKQGSDVHYLFLEVLPQLQPGVLVHVHDVFFPFEYPPQWLEPENRSWNEAYLLQALLEGGRWQVLFWNDYCYRKWPEQTAQRLPRCLRNTGGSIWLQKRSGS